MSVNYYYYYYYHHRGSVRELRPVRPTYQWKGHDSWYDL